jgi:hypothetical protein
LFNARRPSRRTSGAAPGSRPPRQPLAPSPDGQAPQIAITRAAVARPLRHPGRGRDSSSAPAARANGARAAQCKSLWKSVAMRQPATTCLRSSNRARPCAVPSSAGVAGVVIIRACRSAAARTWRSINAWSARRAVVQAPTWSASVDTLRSMPSRLSGAAMTTRSHWQRYRPARRTVALRVPSTVPAVIAP